MKNEKSQFALSYTVTMKWTTVSL